MTVRHDLNDTEILRLYQEENLPFYKIAKILNCGRSTVERRIKKYISVLGYNHNPLMVGDSFANSNLVIIEELPKRKNKSGIFRQWYKIKCNLCGSITEVARQELIKPSRRGCKDCKKPGKTNFRWGGCGDISSHVFCSYKRGASRRKIDFDISIEDCWKLFEDQKSLCALTGVPITFDSNTIKQFRNCTASLDRINNDKGYHIENLRWVHVVIQFMRQEYEDPYFYSMCNHVFNYRLNGHGGDNVSIFQRSEFPKSWMGCGNIHKTLWGQYRKGAILRNRAWELDIQYGWDLFIKQQGICALSGLQIIFPPKLKDSHLRTASLDRIDSTKGYTKDNVQWVHKDINFMKGSLANEEYIKWCGLVSKFEK